MPVDKQLKKMIVFRSLDNKKVIESMIADKAAINNSSLSAITEQLLLDGLLPQNSLAADITKYLYKDDGSIGDSLHNVFESNAAGTNFKSRFSPDSVRPFVEFAKSQTLRSRDVPPKDDYYIPYIISKMDDIKEMLIRHSENNTNANAVYKNDIDFLSELITMAKKDFSELRFVNLYDIILDHWDVLGNWSYTFRLLSVLTLVQKKWITDTQTRYELTELLKIHSKTWN